jgi:hypothetical protein
MNLPGVHALCLEIEHNRVEVHSRCEILSVGVRLFMRKKW